MPDELEILPPPGGQMSISSWVDAVIATLAGRQQGVVARWQLLAAGVGRHAIAHRLGRGRLRRVHIGVYAVAHGPLSRKSRLMAAVLAGGRGAVLSHRAAADLWGIWPFGVGAIDITTGVRGRSRSGIAAHCGRLPADEVTEIDGIPVTTLPRTLLDLAAVAERRHVERAMHEAEVRRLTDPLSLPELLSRYPRRRGTATITAILDSHSFGATVPQEVMQEAFRAFIERTGLPRPEMDAELEVGGRWFKPDCLWRAQRLIVELDGRAVHGTRRAFENDRARDRTLLVEGWRTIRVTWHQLHDGARALESDLGRLLSLPSFPS